MRQPWQCVMLGATQRTPLVVMISMHDDNAYDFRMSRSTSREPRALFLPSIAANNLESRLGRMTHGADIAAGLVHRVVCFGYFFGVF